MKVVNASGVESIAVFVSNVFEPEDANEYCKKKLHFNGERYWFGYSLLNDSLTRLPKRRVERLAKVRALRLLFGWHCRKHYRELHGGCNE